MMPFFHGSTELWRNLMTHFMELSSDFQLCLHTCPDCLPSHKPGEEHGSVLLAPNMNGANSLLEQSAGLQLCHNLLNCLLRFSLSSRHVSCSTVEHIGASGCWCADLDDICTPACLAACSWVGTRLFLMRLILALSSPVFVADLLQNRLLFLIPPPSLSGGTYSYLNLLDLWNVDSNGSGFILTELWWLFTLITTGLKHDFIFNLGGL